MTRTTHLSSDRTSLCSCSRAKSQSTSPDPFSLHTTDTHQLTSRSVWTPVRPSSCALAGSSFPSRSPSIATLKLISPLPVHSSQPRIPRLDSFPNLARPSRPLGALHPRPPVAPQPPLHPRLPPRERPSRRSDRRQRPAVCGGDVGRLPEAVGDGGGVGRVWPVVEFEEGRDELGASRGSCVRAGPGRSELGGGYDIDAACMYLGVSFVRSGPGWACLVLSQLVVIGACDRWPDG